MTIQKTTAAILILAAVCPVLAATQLPAAFPTDVPLADYMNVTGVTEIGDDMMISLEAPQQSVMDVVAWFKDGLADTGWSLDGEYVTDTNAILPFTKNGRRCGITVNDFVMTSSAQIDRSSKGITLQLTAPRSPSASKPVSISSDAAAEAKD